MTRARVVFHSDSNRAHFAMDMAEVKGLCFGGVTIDGDTVTMEVYPGREDDIEDFARRYGGELLWVEV